MQVGDDARAVRVADVVVGVAHEQDLPDRAVEQRAAAGRFRGTAGWSVSVLAGADEILGAAAEDSPAGRRRRRTAGARKGRRS